MRARSKMEGDDIAAILLVAFFSLILAGIAWHACDERQHCTRWVDGAPYQQSTCVWSSGDHCMQWREETVVPKVCAKRDDR